MTIRGSLCASIRWLVAQDSRALRTGCLLEFTPDVHDCPRPRPAVGDVLLIVAASPGVLGKGGEVLATQPDGRLIVRIGSNSWMIGPAGADDGIAETTSRVTPMQRYRVECRESRLDS